MPWKIVVVCCSVILGGLFVFTQIKKPSSPIDFKSHSSSIIEEQDFLLPESSTPLSKQISSNTVNTDKDLNKFVSLISHKQWSDSERQLGLRLLDKSAKIIGYIQHFYFESFDEQQKKRVLELLNLSDHPNKIALAEIFTRSRSKKERQSAYNWLLDKSSQSTDKVNGLLMDGIILEEDPEIVINLILSIDLSNDVQNSEVLDAIKLRIADMTYSTDESTSSLAIVAEARLFPNSANLKQLQYHLSSQSEVMQLAAIKGLHNYSAIDDATMQQLKQIRNADPQVTNSNVRTAAASLLTSLGDYVPQDLPVDLDTDE